MGMEYFNVSQINLISHSQIDDLQLTLHAINNALKQGLNITAQTTIRR
jgi:hypothetical protein